MTKPKLFIGSSVEYKHLALAIQRALDRDAEPFVWTQGVFEPSHFPLESLEAAADVADFAILVCAPEDLTTIRGQQHSTVRDNVIFELGLFIGRLGRKRTFLVSPRGVELHLPTDLSGLFPETYDPDRLDNAEAALGAACSKIQGIISKLGKIERPQEELQEVSIPAELPASKPTMAEDPDPDWSFDRYELEAFVAAITSNPERLEVIDKSFRNSPQAQNSETLAAWEASLEVTKMRAKTKGSLSVIRKHAEEFPNSARIQRALGQGLIHYGDEEGAVVAFKRAAVVADNIKLLSSVVFRIFDLDSSKNDVSLAKGIRQKLNETSTSSRDDLIALTTTMSRVAKAATLENIATAIIEYCVSQDPEDTWRRNNLAYSYLSDNQNGLALLHYSSIPEEEMTKFSWNNLGVVYSRLDMQGKAVEAYQKAASEDSETATSNLSQKLIHAGFYAEAHKQLEAALNVTADDGDLLAKLKSVADLKDKEAALRETLREAAKFDQKIQLRIGYAAMQEVGADMVGYWNTPYGSVELRSDGEDGYVGIGEITREVKNGLLMAGGLGQRRVSGVEKSNFTVRLKRFGNAMEGDYEQSPVGNALSLLGGIGTTIKLVLHLTDDGNSAFGFELGYSSKAIEWKRMLRTDAISHDNGDGSLSTAD